MFEWDFFFIFFVSSLVQFNGVNMESYQTELNGMKRMEIVGRKDSVAYTYQVISREQMLTITPLRPSTPRPCKG